VVSRFIYGTRTNVPAYLLKNGVAYRIVTDHLGSVRLVVNTTSGQVAQRLDYDEFGQVTLNTNPGFQPFAYAGGLADDATVLVHFGHRDYSPTDGRWATKDPVGFEGGSGSLYAYVADPINGSDISGLCEKCKLAWALIKAEYLGFRRALDPTGGPPPLGGGFGWLLGKFSFGIRAPVVARGVQLGDLSAQEVAAIQQVVDEAGRPLYVVGSAAKGARRGIGSGLPVGKGPGSCSDIDYLVGPSSFEHFLELQDRLPLNTGLIPGNPNPFLGPSIKFSPQAPPLFLPPGH
jgi:RHS repeat-associated protein